MKTSEKRSIFNRLFSTNTHGCSAECHCGVMHFDIANNWDKDHFNNTLPTAKKGAKENPKLYQFQDNAIEYLNFDERMYVLGCKCKMDEFIFSILHEERENVLNFYKESEDRISIHNVQF